MSEKGLDVIGPEDYLSWVQHPATKHFLGSLLEDRMGIMESWAKRQFVGENADQTNFLNAKALAQVDMIDQIVGNVESSVEEARRVIKERK